ncbi:MAG: ImmA/IrrE family metallo-endopeptidase [Bacteroidota bacterium]
MNREINDAISACATHDMINGWIVVLNGHESPKRQRFSAAHEFGHMVLMPNPTDIVYCGKGNDWEEKLCDIFAGKLLMPSEMIFQYYNNLPSEPFLEEVATAFQVSPQVAYIRLTNSNLPFKVLYDYSFVARSA